MTKYFPVSLTDTNYDPKNVYASQLIPVKVHFTDVWEKDKFVFLTRTKFLCLTKTIAKLFIVFSCLIDGEVSSFLMNKTNKSEGSFLCTSIMP